MNTTTRGGLTRLGAVLIASIAMAHCGSTTAPSPVTPVVVVPPAASALSAISFNTASVVGGAGVTGTASLTAPAPAGGASILLTGGNAASVPASVLIPAGSMTGTFAVTTRSVVLTEADTITGSYGGVSASAVLSVMQQSGPIANFGVQGDTESETCSLTNGGNTLECTFNGTTSSASAPNTIVGYDWTFGSAATFVLSTTGPVVKQPATNCSLLPSPAAPHEFAWFPLTVTLTVHDNLGNVSAMALDSGARVFPNGNCGF
jgi:uncharacterized lipoprotein NlpE involved in copper resistance